MFQIKRVDDLLKELIKKFPLPGIETFANHSTAAPATTATTANTNSTTTTATATVAATDAQSNPQAVNITTTANGTQPNNGSVGDSRPAKVQRLA